MAAFDGQTKIGRRVVDPRTDKALPQPGSLSFGAMTSPTGLAGCTGIDAKLVNGDRWQQIVGNHTENVSAELKTTIVGDQTHTIMGNQVVTVTQNHTETIIGNCLQTIIGPQIVANMDVRAETRSITHAHTHGSHFFQWDDTGVVHYGITNWGGWVLLVEVELGHQEFAIQHLEYKGIHNYLANIDTKADVLFGGTGGIRIRSDMTETRLKLLEQDVHGLIVAAAPISMQAILMKALAGLHRLLGGGP